MKQELQQVLNWVKPTTDLQWAEDVKTESFDVKFDYQLVQMKESLTEDLPQAEKKLDKLIRFPDYAKYKLEERFTNQLTFDKNGECEGKTLHQWVDDEFQEKYEHTQWCIEKTKQSLERIAKEQDLRKRKIVLRKPMGTTYYLDSSTASGQLTGTWTFTNASAAVTANADGNAVAELAVGDYIKVSDGVVWYRVTVITDDNTLTIARTFLEATVTDGIGTTDYRDVSVAVGTSTANSYVVLDQFTEVARSAGDICIVRRGRTERIDDWSDLTYSSSGTIAAPIVIEADYDDTWGDEVDLSGTATATLTFGSKTVTFSADITGVLATGDWIYADSDNNREFAYEVASVDGDTVTVTLYLPYKGAQAGAGVTMYNIQDNPVWGTANGDFHWNRTSRYSWKTQGITIRGTDGNGIIQIDSSAGVNEFIDCVFIGDGASSYAMSIQDDYYYIFLKKCRIGTNSNAICWLSPEVFGILEIKDCLLEPGNVSPFHGASSNQTVILKMYESTLNSGTYSTIVYFGGSYFANIYGRNVTFIGGSSYDVRIATNKPKDINYVLIEDYDGTKGDTRQQFGTATVAGTFQIQSETGTVREDGATTSIKVSPTTNLSTAWDASRLQLFELPIHATTDSKTYTVYFNLPDANFTVDPTATELWIELEAWGHATNNYRKTTKSTGTITGDGTWRALTLTVAPAQAGVAYLKCYYCKTKEAASNIFYCDPFVVIT